MKNIVLIGFMGSGKSSIHKPLAQKLGLRPIEIDDLILKKSNRKSVEEIFEKDGEQVFRELEIETAKDLKNQVDCVIATGGGVVQNKIILDYLKTNGTIVYLKTSFPEAEKRLAREGKTRPLFKNTKAAQKLYKLREPLYNAYSDIEVQTDGKNIEEITVEIIERIH